MRVRNKLHVMKKEMCNEKGYKIFWEDCFVKNTWIPLNYLHFIVQFSGDLNS